MIDTVLFDMGGTLEDIWVDDETGICLKCEEESDFRGIDHWQRVKFECTEFSTEGLDFSGR